MIFGRKKNKADEVEAVADDDALEATRDAADDDVDATGPDEVDGDEADATDADDTDPDDDEATDDDEADEADEDDADEDDADEDDDASRWADFDASRDWRADGPFDVEEVDLEGDETQRLDFGSIVVTPMPECEIRLQVTEDTQQIIAALIVQGESALELSAYAAPRTPGMWAEIREEIIEATQAAGGTADCVEGPFGTELVRNLPVQTPEGQLAFQPSRTWVAEGPRWLLRGVLFGQAALTDEHDDDLVGPFFDAFSDVIVRRGDAPKPVGDVLELTLPEELQAAQEQAGADEAQG